MSNMNKTWKALQEIAKGFRAWQEMAKEMTVLQWELQDTNRTM